eukprot:jgi/Psemu1/313558/fgenesh1_kg.1229_\
MHDASEHKQGNKQTNKHGICYAAANSDRLYTYCIISYPIPSNPLEYTADFISSRFRASATIQSHMAFIASHRIASHGPWMETWDDF